ncbi:hypothetical protein DWB64_04025 [Fusibacter sp. A1]|nr:hypothetical protein DWB64_04025 [Fusibacter sp. A1]
MNINELSNDAIIQAYADIIYELKKREIVRTKNIIGDLGEYLAISHYCQARGLPKLQFAPPQY